MSCKFRLAARTKEKGSSLFIAIFILLLLSMLGGLLLSASGMDLMIARNQRNEVEATYLAEAGIDLVIFWFNNPEKFTDGGYFKNSYMGEPNEFFKKRLVDKNGVPAFAADGISQFTGTEERPDLEYGLSIENYQFSGLFDSIKRIGRIKSIKIYSPKRDGVICIVESIGETNGGIIRSVTMEFRGSPLPAMTAPIQSGRDKINIVPLKVHWGDIKILGDGNLGDKLEMIPNKNQISLPDGLGYGEDNRVDGWLDIYIGGEAASPSQKSCNDCKEPYSDLGHDNIHQFQLNEISLDSWNYNDLKAYSKEYGRYYSTDQEGNLYQDGILDEAHKKGLNDVISSVYPGDSKGFVFVDTIDQNPPNGLNIPTLKINKSYLEGIFYINGNLVVEDMEEGLQIDVKTPPWDGKKGEETRMPVTLSGINLNGAIYSTGSVSIQGRFSVFGGIYAKDGFSNTDDLEVWYNYNLVTGMLKGNPAILPVKGSWIQK
ncbi:MAG TPA: hypothetical protein VI584_09290 [Nitrospiria bacterium]|nr:hypothetical protein [Nitrospiria bacterium]